MKEEAGTHSKIRLGGTGGSHPHLLCLRPQRLLPLKPLELFPGQGQRCPFFRKLPLHIAHLFQASRFWGLEVRVWGFGFTVWSSGCCDPERSTRRPGITTRI